jgi:hypothetical protein
MTYNHNLAATITSGNTIVGVTSTYFDFTINPKNEIPADGSILINVPYRTSRDEAFFDSARLSC